MSFASFAFIWDNKVEIHMWVDWFDFEDTIVRAGFIDIVDGEGSTTKNTNPCSFKLIQLTAGMVILELNFYCFFLYFFFLFLQLLLEMLHEFTDGLVHKLIIFFMLRQSVYFLIGL